VFEPSIHFYGPNESIGSLLFFLFEVQSEFVFDPGVSVGAFFASDQVPLLPELPGEELADVGQVARLLLQGDGRVTLLLPGVKGGHLGLGGGVAHPLEHFPGGDHPHVRPGHQLVQELAECAPVLLVLEPGGVEVETERRPVRVVVPVEVGHKNVQDLVLGEVGRATVHHGARVVVKHQLVQRSLPYSWKRPGWALPPSDALVGDFVV